VSTRRLRARLERLEPAFSAPGEDRDRDRRRYEELGSRRLKPGGLTHSEEVEFSKLDALFKDLARWEELLWKECCYGPLTEEEAREYAELNARPLRAFVSGVSGEHFPVFSFFPRHAFAGTRGRGMWGKTGMFGAPTSVPRTAALRGGPSGALPPTRLADAATSPHKAYKFTRVADRLYGLRAIRRMPFAAD
jgi:hypothetical protein